MRLISKVVVYHRGATAVGPRGGVYHGSEPGLAMVAMATAVVMATAATGSHGGYGYGYLPYGYGAAAAVGAAVVAPHCWINPYGVRVCH